MEEVGGIVNCRLLLILLTIGLSSIGCKDCTKCEDLPSEVNHLQGEWEWYLTKRVSELGFSYHVDSITPASTSSTVRVVFQNDGCMIYYINDSEHDVCVTLREYRYYDIPGELANYVCAESNNVGLIGDNLDINAGIVIYGPSCAELDTLKGHRVPFNEHFTFLAPPPLPPGHELQGYGNYFKRIR